MKKGIFFIMASSVIWMLSGFIIHVGLGRILGPAEYGVFGVILSLITINFLLLTNGVRQAVAKFTADEPEKAGDIKHAGLTLQLFLSFGLMLAFIVLADPIALLLKDPHLSGYIKLSSLMIPFTGVFICCKGVLEGKKLFFQASILGMAYPLLRVSCIFLFVLLGFKVYGAIAGMIVAIALSAIMALYFTRMYQQQEFFSRLSIVRFALPVLGASIAISLIMHIDILSVKSLLVDDAQTGFYTSANSIARMIYFASQAFSIVLLPSIAQSLKAGDVDLSREYVSQSLRAMLLLLAPFTCLISVTSKEVVTFCYSDSYVAAAEPLSILIIGFSVLTIYLAMTTIIQAYGKPYIPMIIVFSLVPVDIVLNILFIPELGLRGAAYATTLTCILGVLCTGLVVFRFFRALISPWSLFRVLFATSILYFLSKQLVVKPVMLPFFYVLAFLGYLVVLYLLREIRTEELQQVWAATRKTWNRVFT